MSRFAALAAALSLLVLGGLAGVLAMHLFHVHHPPAAEPPLLLRGHAVERLERHLQLTPEQSQELVSILRRARDDGEALRADVEPRLRQILTDAMADIDAMLTPEQRRRFRQVQRRWGREMGRREMGRREMSRREMGRREMGRREMERLEMRHRERPDLGGPRHRQPPPRDAPTPPESERGPAAESDAEAGDGPRR